MRRLLACVALRFHPTSVPPAAAWRGAWAAFQLTEALSATSCLVFVIPVGH
jgi:hypothetical protein